MIRYVTYLPSVTELNEVSSTDRTMDVLGVNFCTINVRLISDLRKVMRVRIFSNIEGTMSNEVSRLMFCKVFFGILPFRHSYDLRVVLLRLVFRRRLNARRADHRVITNVFRMYSCA